MQRQLVPALILLVLAVIGGAWWLLGDPVAPPPQPPAPMTGAESANPELAPAAGTADGATKTRTVREAVAVGDSALLDDPDIRAGLCGFKGRVVTHLKSPVADCGVRIYRGAMDSVLKNGVDLFAEVQDYQPQYIAGEVRTAADGTFLMTGVWPRGFYLMFAGLGTDAPTHQLITKAPSPGQIVDLGDVVLNEAGVITGEVYDDEGSAMAGALVRAADIPGALAAFFPAERFDPEGALLIRESRAPVHVVRMPPWVKEAFEHLPIPTTYTDAEGKFRLVGVMPGSNLLATTARGFLSDVKSSVQVKSGAVKDVGRIRMRQGEELYAKVVDDQGKAVVGAEVVAGSTLSMAPIDLASYLGETNQDGVIEGTGFSPGKVTVAARRSKHHAWVVAEPQSIIGDVIVTLPAQYGFTVAVQMADGAPVETARFRLLRGRKGEGAAEMFMMGLVEPVNLKDRLKKLEDGRWQVSGLNKGSYTLLAEVEGLATGSEVIELDDKDAQCTIKLDPPTLFTVMVVNQEDQPIRNAAIFVEPRGNRVVGMPINCGRTGKDGRLVIDKVQAESLRVSADHPRFGVVHGETKVGEELLLRLLEPGTLHGTLNENGKPPLPGKFTVAVMWRRGDGPRGPLESTPQMITAGIDGTFTVASLQPGNYRVTAISSLDTLRSPGGIFEIAQSMFINSNMANEQVAVVSGQTAQVVLEVGKKPLEGPTAQLAGSVLVDGRIASGYTIVAQSNKGARFAGEVDERGRFDLGVVNAGRLSVSVAGTEGGVFMGRNNTIWSSNFEINEGEQRDLTIDITTSVVAGTCYLPDGSPAAKVFVSARGRLKSVDDQGGSSRRNTVTSEDGTFSLKQIAEGSWTFDFQSNDGDERWRAKIENLEVSPGSSTDSLRVELAAPMLVKGQVDLSGFKDRPRFVYLMFHQLNPEDAPTARGQRTSGQGCDRDGKFVVDDLKPGRYRTVLYAQSEGRSEFECGVLDVPPQGLADVKLVPQLK